MTGKSNTERLLGFIRREYGLDAASAEPANRGYYGETWRVATPDGDYFAKAVSSGSHKILYRRSFAVIDYLCDRGIGFISRIVKTARAEFCSEFGGSVLGVFGWIDGENVQDEESKPREYDMLCAVYSVSGPGLDIPRERFSAEAAALFRGQWEELSRLPKTRANAGLISLFSEHRAEFDKNAERLALFSKLCASDDSHFYITHGDAGGNVMRGGGRYYIVDWDDPVYAPPERDAWFCLHWPWAVEAFNDALRRKGIDYTLRTERLAYYCYHMYFKYLTFYMRTYFEKVISDEVDSLADEIAGYLGGWIRDNIDYADTLGYN